MWLKWQLGGNAVICQLKAPSAVHTADNLGGGRRYFPYFRAARPARGESRVGGSRFLVRLRGVARTILSPKLRGGLPVGSGRVNLP